MLVKYHAIVSLSGGVIIYLLTQSFLKAVLFTIVGIFIDIDHCFDYVRTWGWRVVSVREFMKIFYMHKLKKLYVFLHSYELLILFGLFLWYLKIDWGWVVLLSLTIHISMDQIYYLTHFRGAAPWFYFLFYRASKGFDIEKLKLKPRDS